MQTEWKLKYKYVACDFDGTIATEEHFPIIGNMFRGADMVINKIREYGGQVSIWTCRSNGDLENTINWLKEKKIGFDFVNMDFPDISSQYIGFTRKLCADIYIDNKDIHCIMNGGINWSKIHDMLFEEVKEFQPIGDGTGKYDNVL